MLHLRCCSSPKSASEQVILYYIKYQKTLYGCIHLYSVLLLLLILISFTELHYVLTQFLRLCFSNLDLFFCTISRANEWARTFIYSFISKTRTFFVTSDLALILALETCYWKMLLCMKRFLIQKQYYQLVFFL